jgi:hypothetical protein
MSVLRPRNRLVNFRLSEDEFESLKLACENSGARSISDFARGSVLERIGATAETKPAPGSRVSHLDQKVSELEGRVGELLNLLYATGVAGQAEPAVPAQVDLLRRADSILG